VGVALRFATALGLHVRNEDPSASGAKREVLVRVWWSLYYLERQLSIVTGRPSVIVDSCCSVPLPVPFSEQQMSENINIVDTLRRSSVVSIASSVTLGRPLSETRPMSGGNSGRLPPNFGVAEANSGSYFKAVVQLCIISQSILASLYSAGTTTRPSGDLQQDIHQIRQRIDDWVAQLPVTFNFQAPFNNVTTSDNTAFRQRTMLAFQYCSAKILLTRPCLNGLGKLDKEHKAGASPASFLRNMADVCVETAKMEVDLLPDQPQPHFLYEFGPWWILVHHLMQALAVFLLALSHSPTIHRNNMVLAGYCMKIIRWLDAMEGSQAERAHQVAVGCYDIVAARLSLPGTKMWKHSPIAVSDIRQDDAPQAMFPGYHHPTAAGMGYAPELAIPTYPGAAGDSAPFLYAPAGPFGHPNSRHLYDENFYHQLD
jgi:hypothetical protein